MCPIFLNANLSKFYFSSLAGDFHPKHGLTRFPLQGSKIPDTNFRDAIATIYCETVLKIFTNTIAEPLSQTPCIKIV